MKKTFIVGITTFVFLLSAAWSTVRALGPQQGYVDKSCECHAYALDKNRDSNYSPSGIDCSTGSTTSVSYEGYTEGGTRDLMYTMIGEISGMCKSTDPALLTYFTQNSAIGMTGQLIAGMMINQPASTTYFAYDFLQNAGFVEKAHAQGIGYSGLSPIIDLWKAFRNIAYVILVIVLVVIGFMIMFRMNINPQTVITVQNALPNIVISLLLITFSYAIAGLLIDLTYFLILLIVSIFYQAATQTGGEIGNLGELAEVQKQFLNAGAGMLFSTITSRDNILALPQAILGTFAGGSIVLGGGAGVAAAFWGSAIIAPWAILLGLFTMALPLLIIWVALFFAFVRVFIILLMSYIQLLINIIFAPIFLLFGAIPGRATFSSWLRSLIGNLIVFPATAGLILTANFITNAARNTGESRLWLPPFIASPTAEADFPLAVIGLGFALMIPGILQKIKGAVAPPPFVPFAPQAITAPAIEIMGRGFDVYDFIQGRRHTKELRALEKRVATGDVIPETADRPSQGRQLGEGVTKAAGGQ